MKWPHTAHAGVLAALRCACGYQAIARIGGVNALPGDEGFDGITNVNKQAPHHGLARTKPPGLDSLLPFIRSMILFMKNHIGQPPFSAW